MDRGGEFNVSDIRIAGEPIVNGGQIAECITVKLVGAAATLGSVNNPSVPLPTVGFVDPANAREVFSAGRNGAPAGTVPAFVYEAGELESRLNAMKPASATRISRGMR